MPFPRLASLWRNLVHKKERERDLEAEVRAYAALLEDEMRERGLSPEDVRRRVAGAQKGRGRFDDLDRLHGVRHSLGSQGCEGGEGCEWHARGGEA